MGGTGWIAGAVVMGVLTGWSDATAETSKSLVLPVLVLDGVGLPTETLRRTQPKPAASSKPAGSR